MFTRNFFFRFSLVSVLVFSWISFLLPKRLQAQVIFPPTDDRGAPSRTRGAGSRGNCNSFDNTDLQSSLSAIVPSNNIGTTLSSHPTVYLYVPETTNQQAEFALYDLTNRTRKPIYETSLSLTNTGGIVKLSLPENVALKSNHKYQWYFAIVCDPNQRSLDEYVQGWLERKSLTPDQEARIAQASQEPLEQAKIYAEAQVWQETIAILAQLRETNPTAWTQLLESVGLGELASYPVVDCCQNLADRR